MQQINFGLPAGISVFTQLQKYFCGNFKDLLSICITKDLTNNMINQTVGLVNSQKFQLMQAFQIGDMDKVNNLVKGKGFAKHLKCKDSKR